MLATVFLMVLMLLGPAAGAGENQAVQMAQSQFEAGNYDEAVRILDTAAARNPDDAAIYYWLLRSHYEEGNYDEAIASGERAVKASPQSAEYQRWLGRAYGAKAEQSHSFFLARKVKKAFEAAVNLDPRNIPARRDFMQYLVEAPWIVGGDKEKAQQQIDIIAKQDPLQGSLARASFFSAEKNWKEAAAEYQAVVDQRPDNIEAYMEAAEFFADRKDISNLDHVLGLAQAAHTRDARMDFYRAVVLILRRSNQPAAESLLRSYLANVPQRSDYPSHKSALTWLRAAQEK
jgi:tetratricopeptide (TPR) repeat protein